jgi:hypothetical protein
MLELALPNTHALAVMILIIGALFLFTRETIPLQTTSLVVLVAITVGFTLFPFEADGKVLHASDFFLGFGNKALIAVCGLMLVGQGLIRTGALEPVGRMLAKLWRKAPAISLLFTILIIKQKKKRNPQFLYILASEISFLEKTPNVLAKRFGK